MKCSEIMKTDIECALPTETVLAAAQKMRAKNIGFLPVCDEANNILGTITDRDIALRIVAAHRSATTPVSEAMTTGPVTCHAEDDIHVAEELMAKHQKSRIMCVDDDGKLCGVLSLSDVAHHEQSSQRTRQVLADVVQRELRP